MQASRGATAGRAPGRDRLLALLVMTAAAASCGGGASAAPDDAAGDGGGAPQTGGAGPSCAGAPAGCGPGRQTSCCASTVIPGGTFLRDNGSAGDFYATVSSFRLDRYEITVGRFRRFMAGYPGNRPLRGSGRNPNNPDDGGWDAGWDAALARDATELTAQVQGCSARFITFGAGDESLPMNCISWFDAYAFCIWDGGRLPTEAEWNYAAAGGDQQRHYPWSDPPDSESIDAGDAVFAPAPATAAVGSRSPQGDARWGQSDMAGNVWEWAQDWYRGGYPQRCLNCADLTDTSIRVIRGGDFYTGPENLLTSERLYHAPAQNDFGVGARCARAP